MHSQWQKPVTVPELPFEDIQVWCLHTKEIDTAGLAAMYALLNPAERERADKISVRQVQDEFIAGRGLLRTLLGAATRTSPQALVLETKHNGKPCLTESFALEFNVSHSECLIVIALSRAAPVGVDVEFVSEEFAQAEELIDIARESFSAEELAAITRTPQGPARLLAFYDAWTRRESVAKADGRGIASVLKYHVDAADEFGECRVSLQSTTDASRNVTYFVQALDTRPQYRCAIASRKPRQTLLRLDASGLFS